MDPETDVTPESSPEGTPETTPAADAAAAATPERPVENLKAEMDRKFGQLQSQLGDVIAALTARPAPAAEPAREREYTDRELLELFQSGSKEAGEAYVQRQVARGVGNHAAQQQRQNVVNGQMNALFQRYPVLKDAAHPLTAIALHAKQLLIAQGYANSRETELEAIKTAIADNPELVAGMVKAPAETREAGRQSVVDRQAAVDGAAPRRPATRPAAAAISAREAEIARRMNVDPVKAKERFAKRQKEGRSSVSPMIAMALREE